MRSWVSRRTQKIVEELRGSVFGLYLILKGSSIGLSLKASAYLEMVLAQNWMEISTDWGAVEVLPTNIKGSLVQDQQGFGASSEIGFGNCI